MRRVAEQFAAAVESETGVQLGFDRDAVAWVDGYIEYARPVPAETMGRQTTILGAFLGECLIAVYGGEWRMEPGGWAVRFDELAAVYPFTRVRAHLVNGAGDSVLAFYAAVPGIVRTLHDPGSN